MLITLVLTVPFIFKSKPSFYLWLSTLAVTTVVALAIPYLPFGPLLGFTPLPPLALLLLLVITLMYVGVSEAAKIIYYRRLKQA